MNRHGRSRRSGSTLAPHAQDHGEQAARRARLAAMMKALWAGLQRLGRLLRSFFVRRQLVVEVESPAKFESPAEDERQGRQRGGLAVLYGNKRSSRHKREPRQPPSPPPSPLLIVKGKSVSKELEMQYKEYCRIRASVPVGSCLCHMCFFEMQRHEHMTLLDREMLMHCYDMHLKGGEPCRPCRVEGCAVRVSTERDYKLLCTFATRMFLSRAAAELRYPAPPAGAVDDLVA